MSAENETTMGDFVRRYQELRKKAVTAETVEVTRDKFIEIMVAHGDTREKAEKHAQFATDTGSAVLIGDKCYAIEGTLKKKETNATPEAQ